MAFSSAFSPPCTPQTQSTFFSPPSSHSLSRTTSLLPPQEAQKSPYQPLRFKEISPIVANPKTKRCFGKVKASEKGDKRSYEKVEVFSEEHLAVSLAYDVYQLSKIFILKRGAFSVALSAGFYVKYLRRLVEPPYIGNIEWSKWHFFWVDLETGRLPSDQSDAKTDHQLTYDEFLSKVPSHPSNVYTIEQDLLSEEAAENYQKKLEIWVSQKDKIARSTKGLPKFDVMLLGMKPDGEVGSLAPEHPVLKEKDKWVSVVKKEATSPPRLTLTLPLINASSNIAMVAAGSANASAVYSALKDDDGGEPKLPAKLVSPDQGELIWYLDKGAASMLFKEEVHMEKEKP